MNHWFDRNTVFTPGWEESIKLHNLSAITIDTSARIQPGMLVAALRLLSIHTWARTKHKADLAPTLLALDVGPGYVSAEKITFILGSFPPINPAEARLLQEPHGHNNWTTLFLTVALRIRIPVTSLMMIYNLSLPHGSLRVTTSFSELTWMTTPEPHRYLVHFKILD